MRTTHALNPKPYISVPLRPTALPKKAHSFKNSPCANTLATQAVRNRISIGVRLGLYWGVFSVTVVLATRLCSSLQKMGRTQNRPQSATPARPPPLLPFLRALCPKLWTLNPKPVHPKDFGPLGEVQVEPDPADNWDARKRLSRGSTFSLLHGVRVCLNVFCFEYS